MQAIATMLTEISVKVPCFVIQGGTFKMHVLNAVAQLERDLITRFGSGVTRAQAQGERLSRLLAALPYAFYQFSRIPHRERQVPHPLWFAQGKKRPVLFFE